MNTKDLSEIEIMKRMKLRNTVRKQITTLAGIRRKLLIRKVSKGQRNLIRLTKFSICFLKYGFLKYIHRFKLMKLTETLITFASVKLQSNYFNQSHCATSSHPGPQVLQFLSDPSIWVFTNIYESQEYKGRGRVFLQLFPITSTRFAGTQTLAGRIPQGSHLCRQLAAGLEPGHFGFRAQVANH